MGGERSVCPWALWEAARVGPGGQRCSAHGAVPDAPQGSAPPSLLGGLVGRGSESRGAGPREVRAEGAGISPTKVAGVSDLQAIPGLQSQHQGTTGQGVHRARAELSDQ